MERWAPILDGKYEVSDLGNVRSLYGYRSFRRKKPKVLKPGSSGKYGYVTVCLWADGKKIGTRHVHKLVAEAFIGPRPAGLQIAHLNGIAWDNRLKNLAYATPKENVGHTLLHGTRARGERMGSAKLSNRQAVAVKLALAQGAVGSFLARKYGVSVSCISAIKRGLSWAHLEVRNGKANNFYRSEP